jgi:hypothetical protein
LHVPVSAATFFVKSIRVGGGSNSLTLTATSGGHSVPWRGLKRDWRMSWSWVGVYGAKWIVRTFGEGVKVAEVDEAVRVWVLAMPIRRKADRMARGKEKIETRDWAFGDHGPEVPSINEVKNSSKEVRSMSRPAMEEDALLQVERSRARTRAWIGSKEAGVGGGVERVSSTRFEVGVAGSRGEAEMCRRTNNGWWETAF